MAMLVATTTSCALIIEHMVVISTKRHERKGEVFSSNESDKLMHM